MSKKRKRKRSFDNDRLTTVKTVLEIIRLAIGIVLGLFAIGLAVQSQCEPEKSKTSKPKHDLDRLGLEPLGGFGMSTEDSFEVSDPFRKPSAYAQHTGFRSTLGLGLSARNPFLEPDLTRMTGFVYPGSVAGHLAGASATSGPYRTTSTVVNTVKNNVLTLRACDIGMMNPSTVAPVLVVKPDLTIGCSAQLRELLSPT